MIVPFPAGGSSDLLSRLVAERLAAELKQTIVVDNKAGGQTVIGTQAVATAPADGYTMMTVSSNAVIVGALQKVPYDLHKDLTPVIGIGAVPLLLVVPAKPCKASSPSPTWSPCQSLRRQASASPPVASARWGTSRRFAWCAS